MMLEMDCDLYALPNMHQPYLHDVEEQLVSAGADLDDAHIVYVGGTLYGHEAKARHPGATVTVVEKEPIVAYLQSFAAFEIDQGRGKEDILDDIFLLDGERAGHNVSTRQDFVHVSDQEYEAIQDRHRAFIDSRFAHVDEQPDNLIAEPGVHRNEYLETEDGPNLYSEKELFMSSLDAGEEELEQAFDRLYSHVVEEGRYREETLEQEIASLDLQDEEAVQEEAAFYARNWIDRSHLRWAEENDIYAFVRETDDGKEITTKQSVGRANMYEGILDEIQDTAPVDRVIVDDVRNVELDADILITNNVFDYIEPGEIGGTVDRLTAEDGAYMETSLLNHGYEERGAVIDEDVSPDMELIEAAPDVNFWWAGYGPDRKEDCPANAGVRLYRPA